MLKKLAKYLEFRIECLFLGKELAMLYREAEELRAKGWDSLTQNIKLADVYFRIVNSVERKGEGWTDIKESYISLAESHLKMANNMRITGSVTTGRPIRLITDKDRTISNQNSF